MDRKDANSLRLLACAILCAGLAGLPGLDRNLASEAGPDAGGWADDASPAGQANGLVAILPVQDFFRTAAGGPDSSAAGFPLDAPLEWGVSGQSLAPPPVA